MGRLDTYIGNCGGVRLWGAGGPVCRPYGCHLDSAAGASPRPTVFQKQSLSRGAEPLEASTGNMRQGSQRAGECTRPYGDCGKKQRAHNVRPYKRGGGNLAPHPPQCAHWGTFPPGGRLRKNKKGQVWNLSLKTWRRSGASQKVLLVPFLSRKGTAYFLFQREQAVGESAV